LHAAAEGRVDVTHGCRSGKTAGRTGARRSCGEGAALKLPIRGYPESHPEQIVDILGKPRNRAGIAKSLRCVSAALAASVGGQKSGVAEFLQEIVGSMVLDRQKVSALGIRDRPVLPGIVQYSPFFVRQCSAGRQFTRHAQRVVRPTAGAFLFKEPSLDQSPQFPAGDERLHLGLGAGSPRS
jgi:hypothetical protein